MLRGGGAQVLQTHQQQGDSHDQSADRHPPQSQQVQGPPASLLHQEELQRTNKRTKLRVNVHQPLQKQKPTTLLTETTVKIVLTTPAPMVAKMGCFTPADLKMPVE